MAKNAFWNEASRCGAIVGLVNVAFELGKMSVPSIAFVLGLANFVVTIYLLWRFASRRAKSFGNEGFTYGQSLGFIVAMGIFAGIITGAYQILASNFLFVDKYEAVYNTLIATYSQMGVVDNATMASMTKIYRAMFFSPIWVLITSIASGALGYGFYGLFISIGAKREPDMFDSSDEE